MIDPISLQVRLGALRAACDEMGVVLIAAAYSANIKERRDCSTALFNRAGELVMQAEHIPVHLGAMPAAVAAILGERHTPGLPWILNDPYRGGTHLPDITVITPIFVAAELVGFTANRAHHADVGGPTPGSMPADSHTLAEEGVVIEPQPLLEDTVERLVSEMRQPEQRTADLRAQVAANEIGVQRVRELAEEVGTTELERTFSEVLDYSERRLRTYLSGLPDGSWQATDLLEAPEGDLELCVTITLAGDRLTFDFTGSAQQHEGNLNCPLAVTHSAVLFAVRVLTDPDIPPNAGVLRPLEIVAPAGSVLSARPPAAVVAGNTETSSRVADLILAAFGRALGQGTMNNLSLADEHFTYYETIGGGQGACPDADGPSAVHVAMSNTLNTPVEAFELEFPARITQYSTRRGSGGAGKFRGGDGVIREFEALREVQYYLITERRRHAPRGAADGADGLPGRNLIDGEELPPKVSGTLKAGSRLRVETPGGGGYGVPGDRNPS